MGMLRRCLIAVLAVVALASTASARVTIDSTSFSFTTTSTSFLANCDGVDCIGVNFTPEVYAGDGTTLIGFGNPGSFTLPGVPVQFTVLYADGALTYDTPYFYGLTETAGTLGGVGGDIVAAEFASDFQSDTCATALIYDTAFRISADSSPAINDVNIAGGCGISDPLTGDGKDSVFGMQLPETTEVHLMLDPQEGFNAGLYVVTDCAQPDATCVAASDAVVEGSEFVSFTAQAGVVYYIIVDGNGTSSGLFVLHARLGEGNAFEGEESAEAEMEGEGGEGVVDGEGSGEGIADGEGVVDGEGGLDGEGGGEGTADGEGAADGEGEGDGGVEGEGEGEAPPIVIGFVAPAQAVFDETTAIFLRADFSDDVLENTQALAVRFTGESGIVDLLNDQAGTITGLLNNLVVALTPVREEPGFSRVYLTGEVNNETVVSNAVSFAFIEEAEGEPLDPFEQLLYGFASTDTDSDGLVDIVEILQQFPGFTLAHLQAADSNGDNLLSVAELLEWSSNPVVHSADTNGDYVLALAELLRVIQLYNADAYACAQTLGATEDGYLAREAQQGDPECDPHATDQDSSRSISLSELLRAIQIFSLGSYQFCSEQPSEDGFCPQ